MTKVKRILDETTLEPYFRVTELPDSLEVITERVAYSRGVVRVINDDEIEIRRGETQFTDPSQSREDYLHKHKVWWGMWTPIEMQLLIEGQHPRPLVVQFRPDPATGGWHMRSSVEIDQSKLRRLTEHGLLVLPQNLYEPEMHEFLAYGQHYLLYARVGLRLPGTKTIAALLEARLEDTEDPGDDPVVIQIG